MNQQQMFAPDLCNPDDTDMEKIPKKRIAKTSIIPFKQAPAEFSQGTFFPSNIFDLLPKNHECIIYNDILDQIDVTSIHKNYSVLGQNAFNPKLITGILIYAYSQGIFSSRQIEEKLKLDLV